MSLIHKKLRTRHYTRMCLCYFFQVIAFFKSHVTAYIFDADVIIKRKTSFIRDVILSHASLKNFDHVSFVQPKVNLPFRLMVILSRFSPLPTLTTMGSSRTPSMYITTFILVEQCFTMSQIPSRSSSKPSFIFRCKGSSSLNLCETLRNAAFKTSSSSSPVSFEVKMNYVYHICIFT